MKEVDALHWLLLGIYSKLDLNFKANNILRLFGLSSFEGWRIRLSHLLREILLFQSLTCTN